MTCFVKFLYSVSGDPHVHKFKFSSLAPGQLYDCPTDNGVTLKDIDKTTVAPFTNMV